MFTNTKHFFSKMGLGIFQFFNTIFQFFVHWFVFSMIYISVILLMQLIIPSLTFENAFLLKIELFITVTLGLTGIYISVKAFREASSAASEAKKISKAIPAFFDNFPSMVERLSILIDEAKTELLVFVSLPAYGSLPNPELGEIFYEHFSNKIVKCKLRSKEIEIKMICFSQELCEEFEEVARKDINKYKPNKYFNFKQNILQDLWFIRGERRKTEKDYENVKCIDSEDKYIRMFIADSEKAIFSVVPDFGPQEPSEFNITGFETTDKVMVRILRDLFFKYDETAITLNEGEYKEWKYE